MTFLQILLKKIFTKQAEKERISADLVLPILEHEVIHNIYKTHEPLFYNHVCHIHYQAYMMDASSYSKQKDELFYDQQYTKLYTPHKYIQVELLYQLKTLPIKLVHL